MSSTTPEKAKTKKRGRQGEGGGRPRKQARSGRSITQQLLDDVLHNTPWDDELTGVPTGLSKEERAYTRDMEKDVREMAQDADRKHGPIGSSPYTVIHMTCDSLVASEFQCTLPTLSDNTVTRFLASENTTFEAVTDAVHASLSCTNVNRKPQLLFKLSTDTKSAPWECLTSTDDWAHAISKVREKKARQRGKTRQSVDVQIQVSDIVRCILQSMPALILTLHSISRA